MLDLEMLALSYLETRAVLLGDAGAFLSGDRATHHFLATLFSKILQSLCPPSSWCHAKVITLYKKGDPANPPNFHPIALTSAKAKLFHKILANRLENFLSLDSIIDKSLQKEFERCEWMYGAQSLPSKRSSRMHRNSTIPL